eukprot:jgi/Chrzof1/14719/Cz09g13100.t1
MASPCIPTSAAPCNATIHPAVTALQNGSLGVGFSAAGFFVFYFWGVMSVLQELGVIKPGETKLAGVSSGAIVTTALQAGVSVDNQVKYGFDLAAYCRQHNFCVGILDKQLRQSLVAQYPSDAYQKCQQKAFVGISSVHPGQKPQPLVLTNFASNKQLVNAVAASSYVPIWSGPDLAVYYNDTIRAIDGSITDRVPCPPDVQYCLKVSSKPKNFAWWGSEDIASLTLKVVGIPKNQTALKAAPKPVFGNAPAFRIAAAEDVGIAPNVYNPFLYKRYQWTEMSFMPGDKDSLQALYVLGQKDARKWAEMTGVAAWAARPTAAATEKKIHA